MLIQRRFLETVFLFGLFLACATWEKVYVPELVTNPHFYCYNKPGHPSSYLLGTIHILSTDVLPQFVLKPLEKTNIIFVEGGSFSASHIKDKEIKLKTNPTSTLLTPGQLNEVKEIFSSSKFTKDIDSLTPFELYRIYSFLKEKVNEPNVYFYFKSRESRGAMDLQIKNLAGKFKIPRSSLDDDATNEKLFFERFWLESIPEKGETNEAKVIAKTYQKLFDFYFDGDENKYLEIQQKDEVKSKIILDRRNQLWVEYLDGFYKFSNYIAVGAGHLYGEKGLLALLKRKGYQVHRLSKEKDLELCSK